jgi:hypothetical protein
METEAGRVQVLTKQQSPLNREKHKPQRQKQCRCTTSTDIVEQGKRKPQTAGTLHLKVNIRIRHSFNNEKMRLALIASIK